MRGSIKLFTLWGIPVHLHWSFGLIFVYAFWLGHSNSLDLLGIGWLMIFFVAMFACVLLHEYGHSLTARRYGVETHDIILTPIGGVARLERMPEKPWQEFVVAIAGPAVNVLIALVLGIFSWMVFSAEKWMIFQWIFEQQFSFGDSAASEDVIEESGLQPDGLLFYLPALIAANIWLVLFNLIPAFPMDGGRVFRSLLAMRIGRVKATRWAAWLGQGIAVFFVVFGLWKGLFTMALIGFFVFTTARTENSMVQLEDFMRRFAARDLLRPQFTRIMLNDWMQTPISLLQQSLERHFLVFDLNDQLSGALEEDSIVEAIRQRAFSAEVREYMSPLQIINADASLREVHYHIRQQQHGIIAVVENGQLLGVIDEAGLENFLRRHQVKG
jgi:Zn-dependent protease/predicted transcriptional regulator